MKNVVMRNPKNLKVHKLNRQIYGDEELDTAFIDDIRKNGVLEPIVITDNDRIISGHRRVKAAIECDIQVPCLVREYATADDETLALLSFNMYRTKNYSQQMRELDVLITLRNAVTGEERKGLAADIERAQGMSKGHFHRKHRVWEIAKQGEEYAKKLVTRLDRGEITTDKAYREVREHENIAKYKAARIAAETTGKKIGDNELIRLGDFTKVLADIKDGTVDCILTDPPYPAQFLDEWAKLRDFAEQKLRPGGWLVAYSGQLHLPEIFSIFSESKLLQYYWTLALRHVGNATQLVQTVNMQCHWKPILVFQKRVDPDSPKLATLLATKPDYVESPKIEKDHDDWQQSIAGAQALLQIFTEPERDDGTKDLVLDPFVGTGTFVIAAEKIGRTVIGAEVVESLYHAAKARLATELA